MIPVPTLRELAEKATRPEDWHDFMLFALCREDRAYCRRVSPATMLAVYEALEKDAVEHETQSRLWASINDPENAEYHRKAAIPIRAAIALLDGVTDNAGK